MFEKNMRLACLLDFYGEVLNDRKRGVLELYYNEDYSLSEIADEIGISRQGVRDIIKKSEDELLFLEEKLGLYQKFKAMKARADELLNAVENADIAPDLKNKIMDFADSVSLAI